jgi:hypothetical protein
MTRIYDRRIRQGKEYALDAIEQLWPTASRQVGTADAPVKQDIAVKEHPLRGLVEANVPGGMTRCVEYLEPQRANLQSLAVQQLQVRRGAGFRVHSKEGGTARRLEKWTVLRV